MRHGGAIFRTAARSIERMGKRRQVLDRTFRYSIVEMPSSPSVKRSVIFFFCSFSSYKWQAKCMHAQQPGCHHSLLTTLHSAWKDLPRVLTPTVCPDTYRVLLDQ